MLKVILIDDEEFTLHEIADNINWTAFGFELSEAFSNPFEAMEYIKNHRLDLIITDIEMPLLSGLEIAKYVSENFPETKLVFLTAYSEFRYAQAAIEYRAASYILKPVDFKTIEKCLQNIRNESLNISVEAASKLNDIRNAVISYKNGKSTFEDVKSSVLNASPNLFISPETPSAILRLTIVDLTDYLNTTWKHGLERLYTAVHNIILQKNYKELNLSAFPMVYDYDRINFWVVSSDNKMSRFTKDIALFQRYFTNSCSELLNLTFHLEITKIGDTKSVLSDDETLIKNFSGKLLAHTQKRDISGALDTLARYETVVQFSIEYLRRIATSVFLSAPLLQQRQHLSALLECPSYDALRSMLVNMLSALAEENKAQINSGDIIDYALAYIQNNYMEELSLQKVADEVHLTSAYFGQLFKRRVGKNFIDYLNETRINEAKKLLKTTFYKVNEIATMVGYKNYSYFLKNFIKYTGVSPSEFKDAL